MFFQQKPVKKPKNRGPIKTTRGDSMRPRFCIKTGCEYMKPPNKRKTINQAGKPGSVPFCSIVVCLFEKGATEIRQFRNPLDIVFCQSIQFSRFHWPFTTTRHLIFSMTSRRTFPCLPLCLPLQRATFPLKSSATGQIPA